MKTKRSILLMMALMLTLVFTPSVSAFTDVAGHSQAAKINELQKKGILNGNGKDQFNPNRPLTYADGISLLVKAFNININHIRFVKMPEATDSFPNLDNDAWYADAFIKAFYNGLDIPKNVKANDLMTREQFAHHLFKAVIKQGDFAFIELYMMFEDHDKVSEPYRDSVQKALISKWMTLDKELFNPSKAITRGDAAGAVFEALAFIEKNKAFQPVSPLDNVRLEQTAINEEVNKITITATVGHPGYGMKINSITFEDKTAFILIEPLLPDPDMVYPQVITDISVDTFISSQYKPELIYAQASAHTSDSSSSSSNGGGSSSHSSSAAAR